MDKARGEPAGRPVRARDFFSGFEQILACTAEPAIRASGGSNVGLRPAYRYTAENSVYLHPAWVGRSVARQLMSALLAECEARGLRQVVAVIGDSANNVSIRLHRRLGFAMVGTIRSAGYKFGRWVDIVLMQRSLGADDSAPP
jgi:phosphinothricin acetyltransferase